MKLTEQSISKLALEPSRKDRLVADDDVPSLYVRVGPHARTFLFQATVNGSKKRIPLGKHGDLTLATARAAARAMAGAVAQGRDPAEERRAKRLAEQARAEAAIAEAEKVTLAELLDRWEAIGLKKHRPSYRNETIRALRAAFRPHLGERADKLSKNAVLGVLDAMAERGKDVMAARTAAYGHTLYEWGKGRGEVQSNPFAALPGMAKAEHRDRVLVNAEIGLIWRAAGKMAWPFGPIMQLLLLTAQRRDEVAGMCWSEIDDDGATWTVPGKRSKNGKANVVALSPEARAVIASVPRQAGRDMLFTTTGKTAPSGFGRAAERLHALVRKEQEEAAAVSREEVPPPLPGWHLHDFRRTCVSWLASNGTPPHVADRLLNHTAGTIKGVARIYNRAEYLPERRAALERWAAHVLRHGEDEAPAGNVVRLAERVA